MEFASVYANGVITDERLANHTKEFLQVLLHNNHGHLKGVGGQFCLVAKCDEGLFSISQSNIPLFSQEQKNSIYMSCNSFTTSGRCNTNIFNKQSFYLDLDIHDDIPGLDSGMERRIAINYLCTGLEKAYNEGKLPMPTMITFTGRGLGIFYVLEEGIHRNTTAKASYCFKKTYEGLIKAYECFIKEGAMAEDNSTRKLLSTYVEVDKCVSDPARICRVAGTYNPNADTYSRLLWVNKNEEGDVIYYPSMAPLRILCKEEKKSVKGKTRIKSTVVTRDYYRSMVEKLTALIALRAKGKDKYRHNILFVCSQGYRYMGYTEGETYYAVHHLNHLFRVPLDEREVDTLLTGETLYRFSKDKMMSFVGLTEEEAKAISLYESPSKTKREQAKKEKKKEKQSLHQAIKEALLKRNATQQEIASSFGVSKSTVQRIHKSMMEDTVVRETEPVTQEYVTQEVKHKQRIPSCYKFYKKVSKLVNIIIGVKRDKATTSSILPVPTGSIAYNPCQSDHPLLSFYASG